MAPVNVHKIQGANELEPLLQETADLLNTVQARAFELFEKIVHLCEFGERRVFRLVPLPKPADVDHVSETLDKGLLEIRAVKAEQRKGKKAAA